MKIIYILFVATSAVLLGCRPCFEQEEVSGDSLKTHSQQVLNAASDDRKYDFAPYIEGADGDYLLVTVQAAWVEACRRQATEIQKVVQSQKKVHLVILELPSRYSSIQIHADESRFPLNRDAALLNAVRVLPTTWLLDPSGKLVNEYQGVADAGVLQRSISSVID